MEDLEEKIQSILQDPQQMQQVLSLAKNFGFDFGSTDPEEVSHNSPEPDTLELPDALSLPIAELLKQAGKLEKRQENLLNAIKPFLKPNRQEKIDRALQVARLSHLAGFALRSRDKLKIEER